MMKQLAIVSGLLLGLALFPGCHFKLGGVTGSGIRKTEKRDAGSFHAINTTGSFSVEATSQKPSSIEIEADDNILPLIKAEVRDGVLYVRSDKPYNSKEGVVVRISAPDISGIEATGASMFVVQNLKNDRFEIRTTGASSITASGESKEVEIHITGAGVVDAHSLRAARADVKGSGAASVEVYAKDQLDANVSGVAHVKYSGDPKIVNKHASGAASIEKREDSGY